MRPSSNLPDLTQIDALTERLDAISRRYAEHFGFDRSDSWYLLKLQEELGELTQAALKMQGQARTRGQSADALRTTFENEFADVLGQLLLLGRHHGIDVAAALQRKWLKWADRHERHGSFRLETERLVVRSFKLDDVDALHAYRNDPAIARYQAWSLPYSRTNAAQLVADMFELHEPLRGQWNQFAVERKDAPGLIGDVAVNLDAEGDTAEIGFTFAREHHGLGYAREAVRALLGELFGALDLRRAIAIIDERNVPALNLLEHLGWRREAHFRGSWPREDGQWADELQYALLRSEYLEQL
jgi:RimJ/RimL family protein N-acetyltransferase